MHSIEEKRVYGDRSGATHAYVASGTGVVRVRIAGDAVGEFSLPVRCAARDLATSPDGHLLAVATDEDVLCCRLEADGRSDGGSSDPAHDESLEVVETGFGPAVAVGVDDEDLVAAGPDGRLARSSGEMCDSIEDDETDRRGAGDRDREPDWQSLSTDRIDDVRAIDGDLVGTDDGVYRLRDDRLEHAGLTDVRDVSAAGIPLAAAVDGLYKLGNGWMEILEDETVDRVAADAAAEFGRLERAHAVAGETLFELGPDDEWRSVSLPDSLESPDDRIVGVAYGESVYAATENGRVLARRDGGGAADVTDVDDANATTETADPDQWRVHTIGVQNVTSIECGPDRTP
ncbi:HVO_0234 family beta-propeller protein [Natrarchaeobaculum aegyptiacum]|uniref:HVO-0234-like beta-propeller domain-containing protein n=1 Tax=Natrarchaeobaculum aegyptiacum TaxID=745377 RepID=A0A2Z2HQQ5_9EURY|nr:hypothetical protein [Natrarchaeobaculum aegyptiacum]ARS89312.1 hypothetical protein B1756_05835 [Natrarchaeobaculum aegyptiacum]